LVAKRIQRFWYSSKNRWWKIHLMWSILNSPHIAKTLLQEIEEWIFKTWKFIDHMNKFVANF
jgi:hypothetical protein